MPRPFHPTTSRLFFFRRGPGALINLLHSLVSLLSLLPSPPPLRSAYTATRARRVRGGNAAADALAAAGGKLADKQQSLQPTQPQLILQQRAPSKRRVHRVASAEQLLPLLSPVSLPATPAGKECAMAEMLASGGSSVEDGSGNANSISSSSLLLAPVAVAAPHSGLPPPSPSTATSSPSPRKRGASERSSQSAPRPRGPPPGVAFTSAFAPMASLPPLPGATPKSAAALAADAAARAAAAAWAEAHAKARRAAALVAAAVPVPVGGSLRSAATAPCEIGGSGRRGGSGSFGASLVGGSLNGIGKAPRVTKRVGVSAAKQQRAAAVAAAAAAARVAAAEAAAAAAQNSSLYFGYGELSASQHDVLLRNADANNDFAAGSSSHNLQRPRHHEHVLVGARVAVHSPRDGAFFRATVRDVGSAAGAATGRGLPPGAALLVYDDGKAEVAHLGSRRFRLLAPRASSAGCGAGLLAAASAAGAEGLRLDADCAPAPLGAGPPAGPESARRGAALLLRSPAAAAAAACDDDVDVLELGGSYLSSSLSAVAGAGANTISSAWCRADVVGVDRAARRVRVLYSDGEDEWIDLAAESARGAAHVAPLGALWPPLAPGLAPGALRPEGAAAVGWRVALYCSREGSFFAADVRGFDARTGLHRLAYSDGSGLVEDARLDAETVKWVSPPTPTPPSPSTNRGLIPPVNVDLCSPAAHPCSPVVPNTAALSSPPSPDACRAGSSSFSGNKHDGEANNASGSDTNLVAYGSMGSVSCDAAAVAALAASQREAVAAATAAAAVVAAHGVGSWDPMDAEEDPWAERDDGEAPAAVVALPLPLCHNGNGASAPVSAWWKGDASAAAGVARLTLGTGVTAAAAGNACLLPSAVEEGGDSRDSAVSCDGAGNRDGSSSPPPPTNALADDFTAAVAPPSSCPSPKEDCSVHGSGSAAAPLAAAAVAVNHQDGFHDGACGALVGCGGTATAALAFDTFLVGGDLLDASALGW